MRNSKKGFTIIEMVIVIAIIGILATVLIPTYGNVVSSANESAALQTCRSVMTNWLASSTSSSGVPTSGPDGRGGTLYAAYFEYTNGGTKYQYRYTSGGVERTDNDTVKYLDFSKLPVIDKAYLNVTDPGFDKDTYAVKVFDLEKTDTKTNQKYHVYYIMYPSGNVSETSTAKYAYDFGGATVYAAASADQKIYLTADKDASAVTIAKASEAGAFDKPADVAPFTITYSAGTTEQTLTTTSAKTDATGKLTIQDVPATGFHWVDTDGACGEKGAIVSGEKTFTKSGTLTLTVD